MTNEIREIGIGIATNVIADSLLATTGKESETESVICGTENVTVSETIAIGKEITATDR